MSSIWGSNIKLSLFGESHGEAIGINIDGLSPGIELDLDQIRWEMSRRAPGSSRLSTSRKEKDKFEILSGFFQGRTTGTPLCAIIRNKDARSKDYEKTKDLMRPGHGDFTVSKRYSGFHDFRGGGHFSGRLTAPICFAGAIARQVLEKENIIVGSHIKSIGDIEDESFDSLNIKESTLKDLSLKKLPTLLEEKGEAMEEAILKVKKVEDSIGGIVEVVAVNLPAGVGSPFFDSLESKIASLAFSVPGVKGVEFGEGFHITRMKGSQANDEFFMEDGEVRTYSNHNGGILSGISNGMPVVFRVAVKPTPSIGKSQRTVDLKKRENKKIEIQGRHDPCIVPRVIPVLEAITALAILDLRMELK